MRDMTALICSVSGQDGSCLTRLLLGNGYQVIGTSRDAQTANFASHARLGVAVRIQLESRHPTTCVAGVRLLAIAIEEK
jgi:GDPmannose 4,6-dehydratase